jgi:hypothetical protein
MSEAYIEDIYNLLDSNPNLINNTTAGKPIYLLFYIFL